jgi:hypothetical protein
MRLNLAELLCSLRSHFNRRRARTVNPTLTALLLLGFIQTAATTPGPTEPALSPAESAAVTRQIATLHSSVDRSVAKGWSNSKKVAELICRPAAAAAMKKQIAGTDRVFLGTDDPKTLTLESNAKLTGTGSARNPKGWQDFSFTCEIDPATGKATSFVPVLTPSAKERSANTPERGARLLFRSDRRSGLGVFTLNGNGKVRLIQ